MFNKIKIPNDVVVLNNDLESNVFKKLSGDTGPNPGSKQEHDQTIDLDPADLSPIFDEIIKLEAERNLRRSQSINNET